MAECEHLLAASFGRRCLCWGCQVHINKAPLKSKIGLATSTNPKFSSETSLRIQSTIVYINFVYRTYYSFLNLSSARICTRIFLGTPSSRSLKFAMRSLRIFVSSAGLTFAAFLRRAPGHEDMVLGFWIQARASHYDPGVQFCGMICL